MKSVFVVTSGSYSDFGLDAIFSKREKAEEYISAFPDNECNGITEWCLDPDHVRQRRNGMEIFHVRMLRDGTTESCWKIDEPSRFTVRSMNAFIWVRTNAIGHHAGKPDCLECSCYARSIEHAVKIANEKRTRMIANGEWPTPEEASK